MLIAKEYLGLNIAAISDTVSSDLNDYMLSCGAKLSWHTDHNFMLSEHDLVLVYDTENHDGMLDVTAMHLSACTPIIVLMRSQDYLRKIHFYKSGADDCLVLPINYDELLCRINAILKRTGQYIDRLCKSYSIGSFTFNTESYILASKDKEYRLQRRESQVLSMLCANMGKLTTTNSILTRLWQSDNTFTKRSLDVYICRLRSILCQDSKIVLNTIPRTGYLLTVKE